MLHEFVHAQLFSALNTNETEFEVLFNQYADSKVGTTQQNIIINEYVQLMGAVLSEVDGAQYDIEYYEALSYRGLENTDYYLNNIEGTSDEIILESLQNQLTNGRETCE